MSSRQEVEEAKTLREVLERIGEARGADRVSLGAILQSIGQRTFGALLLVPGLLLVSPLSALPGFGSLMAFIVFLFGCQLVLGRKCAWLPRFVLSRTIERRRLDRAMRFLEPAARLSDRVVHPRLQYLAMGIFARLIGLICLMIAIIMAPLELVPMANTTSGAAIALFGLSLVARDGLLALLALTATGAIFYFGYSALTALLA